ncbi:Hypothetical predicted protein, partial [Pelobates cultripes]
MKRDATKALLWSKQLFYDKANKADTLLAQKLRPRTAAKQIHKIATPNGRCSKTISRPYTTTTLTHDRTQPTLKHSNTHRPLSHTHPTTLPADQGGTKTDGPDNAGRTS